MRALLSTEPINYKEADPSKQVVKKEVISFKSRKPLSQKTLGAKRKIAFRYIYADGSRFQTKFHVPSKAELNVFKAQKVYAQDGRHVHDPREFEGGKLGALVFQRCLDIMRGGPIKNVRQALARLLGNWQLPQTGKFEILIYWKVFEDFDKTFVLESFPSKRFTIDANHLHRGYKDFLKNILTMKEEDFEEDFGVSYEEAEKNIKKLWKDQLEKNDEIPKNTTRAFLEKQILAMAHGRGIYISDQSYFRQRKKDTGTAPDTANMSELCVHVWKLTAKRKPSKKKKSQKRSVRKK